MNPTKELERHRLPCGAATIAAEAVCRRRLRDHFDALLDQLTQETNPEGVDKDILEMEEEVNIPEPQEPEETREEKKARMIDEGKLKLEVGKELEKHREEMYPEKKEEPKPEPTREDRKKEMIDEGKLKNEVKKEVKRHEERLMGNSKLLQDPTGKIKKR